MSIFKCKMCGGALEIQSGSTVAECEYCGAKQTLPKLDDEKRANLYDRANHFRRSNEFDKATAIYEQILNEDGTDAEAYWSLVLCHYGIEYVEDPLSHGRVPTVHRAQFTSIFDDDNYKLALENADSYQRIIYEEEAKAINEIQKGILAISQKEEPFDVFICYKETDANGNRTHDSVLANDLYYQLKQEGFKVFFARITLEDKLGSAYEPYIFAALNSAKVMVVLGTKPEFFNAVWVRNEWSRFLSLIKRGEQKMLIPAYRDMDPYDLPKEFSHLQAQDMSKLGFMQDLIRGIKKILGKDKKSTETITERVIVNNERHDIAPILRRTFLFLEDGNFDSADEYAEKVLDINPECAEAYVAKLLIELKLRKPADLASAKTPISDSPNYQKAIRFATPEYRETIEGYNNAIIKRIDTARKDEVYARGVELMKLHRYDEAVQYFQKIPSYKDSTQKIEDCKKLKETERLDGIYSRAVQAMNAGQFDEAASLFTSISDYKDAKEKVKLCGEKKETARKDAIYSAAMQRVLPKTADDVAIKKSIEEFHTISGYRDVDDQIRTLTVRLEKWYEDKKNAEEAARVRAEEERRTREREAELRRLKAEANKKKAKKAAAIGIPSVVALATLLVLLFTLVIPLIRYNQADKLFNEGKYDEAMKIYQDIGGFSESEQRIAVLNAIEKIDNTKFENGIKEILAAGVPVKLTYGMGGGDFSGATYLSAPQNDANDGIMLLSASNTSDVMPLASTSDVPETTEFTYNSAADFTGIQTPGRNGYRFVKWELDAYNYQVKGTFEIKLNAVWSTKDYTVDYDLAEGTINGKNVVEYDPEDEAFTLINPTRVGYTFAGWIGTDLSEPQVNVTIPTGSYGDRTYTATWTANEYTVTYDAAGGTVSSATQTVTYDSNVEYLIPERSGYAFLGWYENATKHENEKWTRTSDLTLVAKWEIANYTISYELADGTNHADNPTSYTVNDETITIKDPSRTGYTFLGWTYEGQTTPTKDVTIAKGSTGEKTYTANWEVISSTITLNPNGGACDPITIPVTYDREFALPIPEWAGHIFSGWYDGDTKITSGVCKIYEDTTLVAEWDVIQYTVSYTLNGGTNAGSNPTSYNYHDTFTLANPERTGYTFLGWTYESVTEPTLNVTISGRTENLSFVANFKANTNTPYKVEYYFENSNKNGYDILNSETENLTGTTDTTASVTPKTFEHFKFNSSKSTISGNIDGEGTLVLKVYYDRNSYTVTTSAENTKGGSVTSGATKIYGNEITVTATVKVGYTWLGWYAGNTLVCKTEAYKFTVENNVTLTAKWSANDDTKYTVEYYLENKNKTGYDKVDTVVLEGITDTTANAVISEYAHFTFTNTNSVISGNIAGNGKLVLKVYYTRDVYTINSAVENEKAGTVTSGGKYAYENSVSLVASSNPGYTFLGWYEEDTKVCDTLTFTFNAEKNVTYTAKWSADDATYTVNYYKETFTPNGYITELYDSIVLNSKTGEYVSAIENTVEGYVFYPQTSVMSGEIAWDNSTVLEVRCRNTYYRDGEYIYIGEYPQTIKANDVKITTTMDERGYYLGSDGFYYAKTTATIPYTGYTFSTGETVVKGQTYYFKVEPIRWRILTAEEGKAFLLCDEIIDYGYFDLNYGNYKTSKIREWLNDSLFETAFIDIQQQSVLTTVLENDVSDKLFFLSYADVTNADYGFNVTSYVEDVARIKQPTDYVMSYTASCGWWLRSLYHIANHTEIVTYQGKTGSTYRYYDSGIAPAMWITL